MPDDVFVMGETTAGVVKILVDNYGGEGTSGGGTGGFSSGGRPVHCVLVTSGSSSPWTGKVQQWDSVAAAWVDYDDDVRVYEVDGATLVTSHRYEGIRFGLNSDGKWVYVVSKGGTTGCSGSLVVVTGQSFNSPTCVLTTTTKTLTIANGLITGVA